MDKYFGMNKVSVRQKTKVEQKARSAGRGGKKVLYFVSCVFIAALFATCIILEQKNDAVLSEMIRVFALPNK